MKLFQLLLSFSILLAAPQVQAQKNIDSLQLAKELAYEGNYPQSIKILTTKTDIESQQLLARVYAWSHQYEKSLSICNQLIKRYPKVVSHYQIAATTALWGGKWSACYGYANQGLVKGGDSIRFSILQVKALMGSKKWREAESTLFRYFTRERGNKKNTESTIVWSQKNASLISPEISLTLENLYLQIQQAQFQKELSINHVQDYFTLDSSKWKNTSVTLKNKTKYGPLLISAHQSSRFNLTGLQTELEFYPKIDSNYYAYIDLGLSSSELFPNFRNGISLFRSFNKGFEVELGYRNLQFKEAGQVWFYLGSITKYLGNNSLNYRLTSIHSPDGSSATHGIRFTHYLDDRLSFLAIELGSGTNARDYQTYSSFKPFSNINSKRIQVDYKQFLNYRFAIKISSAYENATYRENENGTRYTLGIGLNYTF